MTTTHDSVEWLFFDTYRQNTQVKTTLHKLRTFIFQCRLFIFLHVEFTFIANYFQAKEGFEKAERKKERAKARGDDTWMLSSVTQRLDNEQQVKPDSPTIVNRQQGMNILKISTPLANNGKQKNKKVLHPKPLGMGIGQVDFFPE